MSSVMRPGGSDTVAAAASDRPQQLWLVALVDVTVMERTLLLMGLGTLENHV